jgi:cytochrome c553
MLTALPVAPRANTFEEKAQLCAACHGENGIPPDKSTPVIWGQHQDNVMSPVVDLLERDDMMALAEYFSHKRWPDLRQPPAPPAVAARALQVNVSVGCTSCHLAEYQGDGTQPRLAGQTRDSLAKSMLDFRNRTRGNNPGMSDLMSVISEEDIAALAEYLAGR